MIQTLQQSLAADWENYVKATAEAAKWPPDVRGTLFIHNVAKPIEEALARDAPFDGGAGFLVQRDNGYSGFHAHEAAIAMARRVLRGETPEQALAWLERILATDQGTGIGVLSLWGIEVKSQVDLGRGVTLLPFSELPDSRTKEWLSQPRDPTAFPVFLASMFASQPGAALVCRCTVQPFLHSTKLGEPPAQTNPNRIQSLLDDARLALTLIGPSCPLNAGYWFQFDDPNLSEAAFYGGVSTSYQEVLPWGFGLTPPVLIEPAEAQAVATRFLDLPDPLRATLRLALSRLNQAVRRPPHGDRALDLSIALETLLVDGGGENTYKVGLRAALLVDAPLERRREVRATIGALYTLRSALVHDGVLPAEVKVARGGKRPSPEVVKEATAICAMVLRAILDAGSVPDWYDYELTGGRHPEGMGGDV